MPQVIYESDPPETRGRHGPISSSAFSAGQALLDQHPELSLVILTAGVGATIPRRRRRTPCAFVRTSSPRATKRSPTSAPMA